MKQNNFEVALTKCFFCGQDNQIVMNTRLTEKDAKKVKELHGKVINYEPCPKCAEYMKQGIILVSVRDGESGDNPYRTGGFAVIKDEYIKRTFPPEIAEQFLKTRFGYIEDSVWEQIGLKKVTEQSK